MIQLNPPKQRPPQPPVDDRYDVIVIGGGPAGATAGALLAEYGHRVLILDRGPFPRFHIGESLVPETYWTLERLGLIDWLKKSAFPKKFSVQFYSEGAKPSAPFYFDQYKPHESSQTWQVERAEFDRRLLERAGQLGAVFRTDAQVLDVLFEGERAAGVRVLLGEGRHKSRREVASRVVIDASGQSAFLATRLGLKRRDPRLKKGTVWSYFRGARRDTGKDEGATLIMQTAGKKSWFWYIPLPDDVASIGCTGSLGYMFNRERGGPEQVFHEELRRCPAMKERLADATRITDFLTTKDFSYRASKAAGPGWVLVGDAFGFIDPVYSTGVFLALKSGELAADAIHEALRENDLSAEQLGNWQPQYVEGLELFRRLVYAFYAPEFSFGRFMREHPQYRSNLADMLMGAVFEPGVGEMFEAMGEVLPPSDVENRLLKGAEATGGTPAAEEGDTSESRRDRA